MARVCMRFQLEQKLQQFAAPVILAKAIPKSVLTNFTSSHFFPRIGAKTTLP